MHALAAGVRIVLSVALERASWKKDDFDEGRRIGAGRITVKADFSARRQKKLPQGAVRAPARHHRSASRRLKFLILAYFNPTAQPNAAWPAAPLGWIVSAFAKWVAAENAVEASPTSAPKPVLLHGADHIVAARRLKSATAANDRTQRELIQTHQRDEQSRGQFRKGHPKALHATRLLTTAC